MIYIILKRKIMKKKLILVPILLNILIILKIDLIEKFLKKIKKNLIMIIPM